MDFVILSPAHRNVHCFPHVFKMFVHLLEGDNDPPWKARTIQRYEASDGDVRERARSHGSGSLASHSP